MEGAPPDVNLTRSRDRGSRRRPQRTHPQRPHPRLQRRNNRARTRGLWLIDNDLSYNWKPRLYSVIEHESLIDWLSFHHNEKDEWLRYGAVCT